jgi:3-oxoacyl-[acyl-carrier protein] reductase
LNIVVPGPIEATGMSDETDPAFVQVITKQIPLHRLGQPREVAHAVRFLLDDQSGFITGTTVVVDGGRSM